MPCLFLSHPFLKPGKSGKGKEEKKETQSCTHITTTIIPAIRESKGTRVGCENSSREEMSSEFENPSLLGRTKSFQSWQKVQQRAVSEGVETGRSGSETSLLADGDGGHRKQTYRHSPAPSLFKLKHALKFSMSSLCSCSLPFHIQIWIPQLGQFVTDVSRAVLSHERALTHACTNTHPLLGWTSAKILAANRNDNT